MTISLSSTSDSPEAVNAALGDLAAAKPVEGTSETPPAEGAPDEGTPEEKPESEEPDNAEPSEPENEAEPEEEEELEAAPPEAKSKKKGGFQKRIDKLNAKNVAMEQEKEYWRQEALKARPAKETDQTAPAKPTETGRPKADDYGTHDEYVEALADYRVEQKLAALEKTRREDAIKNEAKTKAIAYNEKLNEFKKSHGDFDDVMESVETIPLSLTVHEAILESDLGPELSYELAKDPKEFARICAMKPVQAAKEIGKIEARLTKSSEAPPEKKNVTKAPPPVTPVRTRSTSPVKDVYKADLMTQAEWNRVRDEQERSRSARR